MMSAGGSSTLSAMGARMPEEVKETIVKRDFYDAHNCIASAVVDLFPSSRNEGVGELEVGERDYGVKVLYEVGKRLWVRVIIDDGIARDAQRRFAFYEVARRGLSDPTWEPLCVDPRDGETVYSVTMTTDISRESLDGFLESARSFLENNGDELRSILSCSEVVDEDEEDGGIDAGALSMLLGIDL